jgi:hypothetical protein
MRKHTAVLFAAMMLILFSVAWAGPISIQVQGSHLVDQTGAVVQLRGANYSGFETALIQGTGTGWPAADDVSGGAAGCQLGPCLPALASWGINAVRIPLNERSWDGLMCTDAAGLVKNPDPYGNYRASVISEVTSLTSNGYYVVLDLHWSAPNWPTDYWGAGTGSPPICPEQQMQLANMDHSIDFWKSVASTFASNHAVIFDLYNEPFPGSFGSASGSDPWAMMMQGTGGTINQFQVTSQTQVCTGRGRKKSCKGGYNVNINASYTYAGYQQMLDAVRSTQATNVVLAGTMQYDQDLSGWLTYKVTDSQHQLGATWHPYRAYGTAWDYPYPNYYPQVFTDAANILAQGYPIVMGEIGGQDTAGTPSCPICDTMTGLADAEGMSVLGWCWDIYGESENVLIKDSSGTPTDGEGVAIKNWMVNHK